MALKLEFVIISAIFFVCIQTMDVKAVCHLDHMKRAILTACENVIDILKVPSHDNPRNERLRREILESINSTGKYYDENRHIRPTHLIMRDRNFPAGGYIVVDHVYAKMLKMYYPSTYHVIPKTLYHHQKNGKKHRRKLYDFNEMRNDIMFRRHKRNGHHSGHASKDIINFTYCCTEKCRPYDLCEL